MVICKICNIEGQIAILWFYLSKIKFNVIVLNLMNDTLKIPNYGRFKILFSNLNKVIRSKIKFLLQQCSLSHTLHFKLMWRSRDFMKLKLVFQKIKLNIKLQMWCNKFKRFLFYIQQYICNHSFDKLLPETHLCYSKLSNNTLIFSRKLPFSWFYKTQQLVNIPSWNCMCTSFMICQVQMFVQKIAMSVCR